MLTLKTFLQNKENDYEKTRTFGCFEASGILFQRKCDGKILLLRRASETGKNMWATPGGKVDGKETPLASAKRECYEEMGEMPPKSKPTGKQYTRSIALSIKDNIKLWSNAEKGVVEIRKAKPGEKFTYTTFLFETDCDDYWHPKLNWEHNAWGWFDPFDPPKDLFTITTTEGHTERCLADAILHLVNRKTQ